MILGSAFDSTYHTVWNESEYMHLLFIASMDTLYNGTLQVHQSSTSMSAFPLFIDEMPGRVQHFSIIQYSEHDNHTKKWHEICILLKGLRPVLKGFVATMHEGACEQEVQSRGRWSDGLDALFTQARVHCHCKTRQFALNHGYDMTFRYLTAWILLFQHSKGEWCARARAVSPSSPIVTSRGTI